MMRKLAVSLALASTALATPAFARDNSWYVGVEGGGVIVEDIKFDINTTRNAGNAISNYGFDVDGNIGYDFGRFRVEAEVGYRRAALSEYVSTVSTPVTQPTTGRLVNAPANRFRGVGGATSALSFMVNGLIDFGDEDQVQGFFGGGVGIARVKAADYALNASNPFIDDSDTVFAYQGIAGVRAPISRHLDISVKYRFFTAPSAQFVDVRGRTYEGTFRTHSLLGGITYNFGAPTPPAPPPPPPVPVPPPPPPPAPAPVVEKVCTPGPYIVFFEWDKSTITTEAAGILDNAIAAYQDCGNAQVMLAGHADRSGTTQYNVGLSQRRADAVKAYLSARSIPEGVITTQAFGESQPLVPTADGVRELQNRRVEVTYGPGSGN